MDNKISFDVGNGKHFEVFQKDAMNAMKMWQN